MSFTDGLERATRASLGQLRGVRPAFTLAERFNLSAFSESLVWNGPTEEYIFTDPASARINRVSSDSTLDTDQILIVGLNEDWEQVEQIVTLNGQNKVNLSPELVRFSFARALNDLNGNVYIYEDTPITTGVPDDLNKVKGFVDFEVNISQQAILSVPVGFTVYFLNGIFSSIPAPTCCVRFKAFIKYFEGVKIKAFEIPVIAGGTTALVITPKTVVPYPEKSDIFINVYTTTPGTGISVQLDWELIRS